MLLYLFKSEGIIAALVPVALAVDGMEIEAAGAGGLLPIAALGACDALHVDWSAAGVGVAMPMAMEMLKAAAKAARGCAAKRHAIGTRSGSEPGAAVDRSCRQRTRDRAEGGAPHQGQHDTARAFHDEAPGLSCVAILLKAGRSGKLKRGSFHRIVRNIRGDAPDLFFPLFPLLRGEGRSKGLLPRKG